MKPRAKGVSVVEIIIGISVLALVVTFVLHTSVLFFGEAQLVREKTKALYLAEEGVEMLRYLRSEDWNILATDLTPNTTYYLAVSTTTIATTTTAELIDGLYERSFRIEPAYRNDDDDLVASTTAGATIDSGSWLAHVSVAHGSQMITLSSLLANIHDQ